MQQKLRVVDTQEDLEVLLSLEEDYLNIGDLLRWRIKDWWLLDAETGAPLQSIELGSMLLIRKIHREKVDDRWRYNIGVYMLVEGQDDACNTCEQIIGQIIFTSRRVSEEEPKLSTDMSAYTSFKIENGQLVGWHAANKMWFILRPANEIERYLDSQYKIGLAEGSIKWAEFRDQLTNSLQKERAQVKLLQDHLREIEGFLKGLRSTEESLALQNRALSEALSELKEKLEK